MAPLIFILGTLALLGVYIALTDYEVRKGVRYFAPQRERLDHTVERVEFIMYHVDLAAFLRSEVRRLIARVSHDVAHFSLQAVRATERLLTHVVRYLRSRHAVDTAPRRNVREFIKTLSDFKDRLKNTHPKVGDIQ